jgi:peptide/nickel transport system permease protein
MPTLFWTDALFFLVLLMLGASAWRMRSREHLLRPWQKVANSRPALISLVVLLFFLFIALLDSIHFYPTDEQQSANKTHGSEALSLLDWWATPMRTHIEKTYSAPFAIQAWSRESIRDANDVPQRIYPRLQYGGAHLSDPQQELTTDILKSAGRGLLQGAGIGLLALSALIVLFRKRPPLAVTCTLLLLCAVSGAIGELSAHYHVFGTDKVGEDVLYQSVKSIRTGLLIGTLTTLATLPLALLLGIMAGYFRGWVDDIIQYIYSTLNSIPGVLLIAASMLLMQSYMARHEAAFTSLALRADFRLLFLCLILGLTSWTGLCRLLRAETLKLREMEYVQAARVLGVSQSGILFRHILPNVFHLVLISVVLDFSSLVLAEAVLSYVNIGVDPTMQSWGNMINSARLELAREPVVWWSLSAALVFMFVLVLSANIFADSVRDAFDPRRAE